MNASVRKTPMGIHVIAVLTLALATAGMSASATDTPWATNRLTYDGAVISNLDGGVRRSSTYLGNLHVRSLLDLERGLGWTDTRVFVDTLWIHGGQPDAFIGDAMGVNNLSAPPNAQLEELWLEHNLQSAPVSVLAGLYDLNSEFYRLQSAGLFLNSSFGIGPEFSQSGIAGPSIFPRTALGARVAYKPGDNVVLRAAVLDGAPLIRAGDRLRAFEAGDGRLYVAELALFDRPGARRAHDQRTRIGRNAMLPMYQGKLAVGAWHYTTTFERIQPVALATRQRGASGYYVIGDGIVARDASDPRRNLSLFAQMGVGDPAVNRFGSYIGAGLVAAGPFRRRSGDELGLAIAIARNGRPYRRQSSPVLTTQTERSIELSYLAQLRSWLAIQPDLQYVIHPNTDPTVSNALVFTLRFELSMDL